MLWWGIGCTCVNFWRKEQWKRRWSKFSRSGLSQLIGYVLSVTPSSQSDRVQHRRTSASGCIPVRWPFQPSSTLSLHHFILSAYLLSTPWSVFFVPSKLQRNNTALSCLGFDILPWPSQTEGRAQRGSGFESCSQRGLILFCPAAALHTSHRPHFLPASGRRFLWSMWAVRNIWYLSGCNSSAMGTTQAL